jgi:hypothetical protein
MGGGSPASPRHQRRALPDLKLRLRRRARGEDRIRWVKDIGLANLPFHDAASNAVWLAIVLLACDLLTWTQTLSLSGPLRVAEPNDAASAAGCHRRAPDRILAANPATAGPALALAAAVAAAVEALRAIPDPS